MNNINIPGSNDMWRSFSRNDKDLTEKGAATAHDI